MQLILLGMDNKVFLCNISNTINWINQTDQDTIISLTAGVWLLFFVSGFGLVSNCTTLITFINLGWYKKRQYLLLLNLAVVELINSVTFISGSTTQLIQLYFNISNVLPETYCFLVWIPSNVVMTCSPVLAMFIAIDRLYCILYPFRWITMKRIYWHSFIVVSWIWATIVQCGWLFFTSVDLCVQACTFVPFPNVWWSWVVKISDVSVNIGVIIIYIVIPLMAAIALKSCSVQFGIMSQETMVLQQKFMIAQIQAMSTITIVCFICTYGVSFVLADFNYLAKIGGPSTAAVVQQITACLLSCNSTISFLLYFIRNQSFRRETSRLCFRCVQLMSKIEPETIKIVFISDT